MLRRTGDQGQQLKYYTESAPYRRVVGKVAEDEASLRWHLYVGRGGKSDTGKAAVRRALASRNKAMRAAVIKEARTAGDLTEIEDHPWLEMRTSGNPLMDGHQVDKLGEIMYCSAGESFVAMEPNPAGVPYREWILPPHWIMQVPSLPLPFFQVVVPTGGTFNIPPEWMVWDCDASAHDPYWRGIGTGSSLAAEIESDDAAATQIRLFFEQGMRPDFLLMGPGLDDKKQEGIRNDWVDRLSGLYKRWMFHMLDAPPGAQYIQIGQDFDGQGLTALRTWEHTAIRQVFGVTPEVLGEILDVSRATATTADRRYQNGVLVPRAERKRRLQQNRVLPLYKSPRHLVCDYELPPTADPDLELGYATLAPYAASLEQHCLRQGIEPPKGSDKVYFLPIGVKAVTQADILDPKPPPPPPAFVPMPPKPGAPAADPSAVGDPAPGEPGKAFVRSGQKKTLAV